jgi:sulfate transport system ATP-binding protein
MIEAVIPNERFRELGLRDGETLLVKPRRMHVFVDQGDGI